VAGSTSLGPVVFHPGSVEAASDYPVPVCLDHDTTRPIGVVAELTDTPDALRFVAALDPIPAAEHARAQMRSRSRSGVSVGVEITAHDVDNDGTVVVTAGELVELSSVVRPAFTTARVAAADTPPEVPPMPDTVTVDAARSTPTPDPTPDPAPVEQAARVPAHVQRSGSNVSVAPTLSAMLRGIMREVKAGADPDARTLRAAIEGQQHRALTAALSDVTRSDWPAPGTWLADLDNYVRRGMPEVFAFTVRPTDNFPVYQLGLQTKPIPGKQAGDKTPIASNSAQAEWSELSDDTYAWGADVSVQMIEDNGEQALGELVEVAGEEVGRLVANDLVAAVIDAAQAGPSGGPTLENLGTAIGTVAAAGVVPDRILAAPDVYGKLWTLVQTDGPGLSSVAGLTEAPTVVLASSAPAGTCVVGSSTAVRTHMSREARMRAVEVSLLGVNVGVYRRAAFRVRLPQALVAIGPAGA
jgi:HK97 family phage prohead protease